jgi:hypothetical protein
MVVRNVALEPRRPRVGVGDAAAYLPNILASLPSDQAAQLNAVINNFEQVRSAAKVGIATLAAGRGVTVQQMTAVVATAVSLVPALGPIGGAFVAEMGILQGLSAAVQSILDPLGLTAKGSVNNKTYCGWIAVSTGGSQSVQPPYGPNDPNWRSVPHPDVVDMSVDPAFWTWGNVGVDGNIGSHLAYAYAGEAASSQGSFEEFFYIAMIHNAELQWNCQPSAVDPQVLLRAAQALWNEVHSASSSYTITPHAEPDSFNQSYNWHDPDMLISWIAAGSLSPPGTPSLPPLTINSGPLINSGGVITGGGRGIHSWGGDGGTPLHIVSPQPTSTTMKVVKTAAIVGGGALAASVIYAFVKKQTIGHVWGKAWEKTKATWRKL